jgi:hypothetical protein
VKARFRPTAQAIQVEPGPVVAPSPTRHRARLALLAFGLSFIAARVTTFLIMAHRIPDVYLHLRGTHIHHLNYGIFLLAGLGAYLLFAPVTDRGIARACVVYGIGLALTFDEFGMWLHLGGGYWQRASFDAIVVLAALLALLGFAPPLSAWRPRHIATAVLMLGAAVGFYLMLAESFRFAARVEPRLERLERAAPP